MRVLAVMCHPDDMEFKCAGTLIRFRQLGHDVIACNVTNGNMGHITIPPEELRLIRQTETRASCAIAGIESITADIGDLTVNAADQRQKDELLRIIRYANPDIIITHDPKDYCSDHNEVSKLVFDASYAASCPQFKPELGKAASVTPIYYADTDDGMNFVPTEYVDISSVWEQKLEMIKCHKSQIDWLSEHDNYDALAEPHNRSAFWGKQCGVIYAEAFRPLIASGRMRPYRLLP